MGTSLYIVAIVIEAIVIDIIPNWEWWTECNLGIKIFASSQDVGL